MKRPSSVLFLLSLAMVFSLPVLALTGADVSPVTPLETVSPTVQSATALTERSLSVSFSEPLLSPGATTPGNYTVSGAGRGTLAPSPDTVTGSGPYTLTWTGGEMRDGAAVTVTVLGVQDAVGNPLLTASATASAAGIGVAPVFTALSVAPSSASVGDTVTVTFTASEPLDGDPAVTVNGHPAVWVSGAKAVDFTYTYEVAEEDAPGMAAVSVSGYDLAGNMGSLESATALEINEADAGLPVRAWPLAMLLGGIMVLVARRRMTGSLCGNVDTPSWRVLLGQRQPKKAARSRFYIGRGNVDAPSRRVLPGGGPNAPAKKKSPWRFFLFLAAVLAAQTAFAAPPAVSNVSMVQQDNGAGGTEVVITYDLDAPNGPCDITVSLSKDGGVDGYVFPVTSVTGDVSGVAGGAGKQIVWDLRADYPEEALPNARIRLTADDGLVQHTLTYTAGVNGTIAGDNPQVVNHGADGTAVTAVPDPGYHFTQWSDGVLTATRQDLAVTGDITVTAEFAINAYTLTYTAGANGSITGDSPQTVNHGADGTAVTAVPDANYHFTQWSDGVLTATRQDTAVTGDVTVTAAFAINTYTLTYTAGANGSITGDSPQTVNHGADGTAVTAVADANYHFTQWSDGVLTAMRQDLAVTGDITVTAEFAINTYTLTYTAGANGTITGDSPQTVNHGADGMAVTAVPDGGYVFTQWSDGVLTATRQDTGVAGDVTVTASFAPVPEVTTFAVNSGAATTMPLGVTLDNTATNSPAEYMASESATFTGATWQAYGTAPAFTLSFGVGTRTVYFKVRDAALVESGVVSDTIFLVPNTVPVAAGAFDMGRLASGTNDDRTYGTAVEDPVHSVTLGAYSLGKHEVTNKEYCDVLNWALAQGYLLTNTGTPWAGSGSIYAGGAGFHFLIVSFASPDCNIQYSGGVFTSKTRVGLPGTTNYSMDTHPMVMVSWYGSVAYCNWLSLWQGLTPCYDMTAANWPLTVAPPTAGGYRLPTEAEWERAAAWDGVKHWIYGFLSDTNASGTRNRCNDFNSADSFDNPLGLTTQPYTSPVGWFNGVNVSPNGSVTTGNSPSPVGAYDMSGNVWEWCGDWYLNTYYGVSPASNPTGPATGTSRVLRGGSWGGDFVGCRSARRYSSTPGNTLSSRGFRVSRTPAPPEVTAFMINSGAATTMPLGVTLNNNCTNSPTEYMASESATFAGAVWTAHSTVPPFNLSFGVGMRTVYFKARNAYGESGVVSDTIFLEPQTVPVAAGGFNMGRLASGTNDDRTYGTAVEDPVHSVTLGAYSLGKHEVTNKEYCDVLNWALAQGYLLTNTGTPWAGTGDIWFDGDGLGPMAAVRLVAFTSTNCNIQYSGGVLTSKTRVGLPGATNYSMDTHPMLMVSWYGSVAYCNWLSQMQGLTPCYNLGAANWPLTVAPPTAGGYRLPTEAEWERAAAWDGVKHWIYGFLSDTLGTATNRANDYTGSAYVNPLGLTTQPYTSPVGWFNGTHVSPNGSVTTVNSPSPVGAYDMSGNVWEWCGDWYLNTYYGVSPASNPTGPATGTSRVFRGGSWNFNFAACRSARRYSSTPDLTSLDLGFRVSRTP